MNKPLNRFSKYIVILAFLLVCFGFETVEINKPTDNPDRIILNFSEETSSGINITWRTDESISKSFCQWLETSNTRINPKDARQIQAQTSTVKYTPEREEALVSNHHSVSLTGLEAGKKYLYRVGSEKAWSEWFEFALPDNDSEFSFIYFGDPQNDIKSQWSRIIRSAYRNNPDCAFMLYAGDLINTAGSDVQWDEWFKAGSFIYASVPQLATPGNHDYIDYTLDPHWNAQFSHPMNGPKGLEGTCYYVDYKNMRLVSFDTAVEGELENEDGYALVEQKKWLDKVLKENTKDWLIVTTHLPFYSPKESRDNNIIRKHFQPILENNGVDMVLGGHDHSYARGMATDSPGKKPEIMYVVSVSGPKLYEAGDKKWMQRSGSHMILYQNVQVDNDKLTFEAYTADGELFDKFTLKMGKNGKNKLQE